MSILVNENGVWIGIEQPYVNDAGTWRTVATKSVNDAGTWRTVFPDRGELWIWGNNFGGQLGNNTAGNTNSATTPITTFAGGTNWKQVACGNNHTAAIKTDGTLWTWGRNVNSQLGTNDQIPRSTPVTTFAGGTNWKQVACGNSFTVAIKTDGTLWGWGAAGSGQLGNNSTFERSVPVTTFAGGTNWKQVAGGTVHTAAIKTDGTLWTWGTNGSGQLGHNTPFSATTRTPVAIFAGGTNWKQVACGNSHTAAIKTDGTLWTWGDNTYGQLGNNTIITRSAPVTTFAGGTNWKQVACGGITTAAIKTDGTLWTWGPNTGDNTTIWRSTPVTTFAGGNNWRQVGHPAIAIKIDGTLWEIGITPITTFAGGTNWKQVAGANSFRAAIR